MTSSRTIEGLPVAVVELDESQTIVDVDARAPERLGMPREALVGRALEDLFSPKDRRGALEYATRLNRVAPGGLVDVSIVLALGGADRLTRVRTLRRDKGYLAYLEPTSGDDDPTQQLMLAKVRWESMVRRSEDGIVRVSSDGRILEHNGRFFELMKFRDAHGIRLSEDALAGRSLVTMLGPELFPGLAEYLAAPSGDFIASAKQPGIDSWLELRAFPLVLPTRALAETFIVVRDVSDERRVRERDAVIARDIEGARAFQRAILASAPPPPANHDIEVLYEPLERVGGDLYDVAFIDDDTLRLFVADATGHGVSAGLATMLIKSAFELVKTEHRSPGAALAALNEHVAGSYASTEVLFTAVIADVNVATGTVRYALGAHPPPVIVDGGEVTELAGAGGFIGVARGLEFEELEAHLRPGAGLYLFTDGFYEARNVEDELFGEVRLHRAIAAAHLLRTGGARAIYERVVSFARPRRPDDDMTMLIVRRLAYD